MENQENVEKTYCRFCAELKTSDKLLNLKRDTEKQVEIQFKLSFMNAFYVNVSTDDMLPKALCFVCYDSLNQAYTFLETVKNAQDILINLLVANDDEKCDLSDDDDDDKATFEDLFASEDSTEIKTEVPATECCQETFETTIEVKSEPKEEQDEPFNQTLNVQDILDAAMCDVPYTSNMTIFAKEVSNISKVTKNWNDYPWICAYCNVEFLTMDLLRSHSKMVHGKCDAYTCFDCKSTVKGDLKAFVQHVRRHRKALRSSCYFCGELVTENLRSHIRQHFPKSEVSCPFCGEILSNEESLKIHLHNYSSMKQKRKPRRKPGTPITVEDLTCDLCNKVYKTTNSLRDHRKLHIIDRKRNYTCDRCGKTFFNKGTLTSHIIMAHDKIRPHTCKICNKSFLFPNMLRRHVEMHTGSKPFSCEQCGRCFRLQYQLNSHKIIHTDSMPYVCQYCNKAFRFKQILKNHEHQHTGAKPYSCQHCSMEFTNWSNYNKHMKRRHGTDTSKKKITPEGVFPINPETGQIVQLQDVAESEEWKRKIMIPTKRGKKKGVKPANS